MNKKKITESRRFKMALFSILLISAIWFYLSICKDKLFNETFYRITIEVINSITIISSFIIAGYSGRDIAVSIKGGYPPKDEKADC